MAELDPQPAPRETHDPAMTRAEREDREIIQSERSQLVKLSQVVRLADFMAILMVIATIFSAYAAWRTADVTRQVYSTLDRPFLGVQSVQFEAKETSRPTIAVEFRNFGQIPAVDGIVTVRVLVNGKIVAPPEGTMSSQGVGIMSPTVPHFFYGFLASAVYDDVISGKSNLQILTSILYKGTGVTGAYCYHEHFVYDFRSATFRATEGSDRCGGEVF